VRDCHQGIPIINSSRSIIYAGGNSMNWELEVSRKAEQIKESLNELTKRYA